MKIAELRTIIKGHQKKDLEFLVAELYKLIPKNKKEDNQIDELITKPVKEKKVSKANKAIRTIEEISSEVKFFHQNALNQNYLFPNSVVPKKDRSKWRFLVKRLVKEINLAAQNGNSRRRCAEELQVLYETLCYACAYQTFTADDPFESVGISQIEFFDQMIKYHRDSMDYKEFIDKGIKLIFKNELSRYTLYSGLMETFINYCQTPNMKEVAIERTKKLWDSTNKNKTKKTSWRNSDFEKIDTLNHYSVLIFRLSLQLSEYETAIEQFKTKYIEKDKEIVLYIYISILFTYQLKDIILKELQTAKSDGIEIRPSLVQLLKHIQKHNQLPDYI